MDAQSNHFQSLAMTVLAIATAVIGFGLFGSGLQDGGSILGTSRLIQWIYGLMALLHYGIVVELVRRIIRQSDPATGEQVANGPLLFMALQVAYVAMVFIVGAFENPTN